MQRRLGVDIDGVLADFDAAFYLAAWRQGLLLNRLPEDQKRHDFLQSFPGEITDAQIHRILLAPAFYRWLEPHFSLVEMVQEFHRRKWEIHLVTARPDVRHVICNTRDWANQHRIPFAHLTFLPSKEKHLYAEARGLTLFVEDRLETANAVAPICSSYLVANHQNVPGEHGNPPLHSLVYRRPAQFYHSLPRLASH